MKMQTKQIILSRLLPKTGQTQIYGLGDDGFFEAGWWLGKMVANNKTRFVSETLYGHDIVRDLATGLMWAVDGNEAGCNDGGLLNWANALDYALNLTFAGFGDWRIPNILELLSIINFGKFNPAIDEPPFANTNVNYCWTSTTSKENTNNAWAIYMQVGDYFAALKTGTNRLRCVRQGTHIIT